MVKNIRKYDTFNQSLVKREKLSYRQALRIYEMLLAEAVNLGVINSHNMLEGIEVDIKLANVFSKLARYD